MEIWKDIKGFEGLYKISNFGRVKSINRKAIQKNTGNIRTVNEKIRKTAKSKNGYEFVVLSIEGTLINMSVHRLVAINFLSNENNYKCVNHKDGNKYNNNVDNLEWCSYKQNQNHSIYVLGNRKRAIIAYDLNLNKIGEFDSIKEASNVLKIYQSSISAVLRGLQKRAYNYKFKYKK